jgi:hypothetical protein
MHCPVEADIRGHVPQKNTLIQWSLYAPSQGFIAFMVVLKRSLAPLVVELCLNKS